MERKVIIITGPTCSGKTKVGISLAKRLGTEIISADSRQFYKHLEIGTAKPVNEELKQIKHHLIDFLEPDENYNVSKFETDALKIIEHIFQKGKIPFVVGGSGLYIKGLIDGIFNTVDVDEDYREELKIKREQFGNEFLYNELKTVDPETASKLLPQNWKRIMRALEVFHLTSQSIRDFQNSYTREIDCEFIQYGLNWQREVLYQNINRRVDSMMQAGLVDEVKNILGMGYSKNLNSLNTVGYKEIISYLDNEITLERAIGLIKRNTRRYAKRQMTWFRKDDRINWINIDTAEDLNNIDKIILDNFN
jgi:tRNA dimethylallyltransferase